MLAGSSMAWGRCSVSLNEGQSPPGQSSATPRFPLCPYVGAYGAAAKCPTPGGGSSKPRATAISSGSALVLARQMGGAQLNPPGVPTYCPRGKELNKEAAAYDARHRCAKISDGVQQRKVGLDSPL